jgi:NADH-quinone oxidoreductase subunit M
MLAFSEIFWSQQSSIPLLLILQLLPLFGAAVVLLLGERPSAVRAGKVFALAELLLCIVVISRINPTSPTLQLAERFEPLAYHVAVDGLSHGLFAARALLTFLMTLYGMSRGMISPGRLFAVLLVAEAGWSACW